PAEQCEISVLPAQGDCLLAIGQRFGLPPFEVFKGSRECADLSLDRAPDSCRLSGQRSEDRKGVRQPILEVQLTCCNEACVERGSPAVAVAISSVGEPLIDHPRVAIPIARRYDCGCLTSEVPPVVDI